MEDDTLDKPTIIDTMADEPLQIIELKEHATEDGGKLYSFDLCEENLDLILAKVPVDMKVSVVSVVGNFRTGKSFLLTFMLRFLRNRMCEGDSWQTADGENIVEGNLNQISASTNDTPEKRASKSFDWRGGHERMTTGIWMYSKPFIQDSVNGQKVAVLIVDTQGLFDNETTMLLTSCIFGLSTLMSSYQIYNVKERIAEDNLQQLALFSEYGRMALDRDDNDGETTQEPTSDDSKSPGEQHKAFQRLEFLVRDWPDFEDESQEHRLSFMNEYIEDVILKQKSSGDLQETRDQITSCFTNISCYLLPHPGLKVQKKSYNGDISGISSEFREMLTHYMNHIFNDELEPKKIDGHALTATELGGFVKTYVKLFKDGGSFPEARTVLQATAEANNNNALNVAYKKFEAEMDLKFGPQRTVFVKSNAFDAYVEVCKDRAFLMFDDIAKMGAKKNIDKFRTKMENDMAEQIERYRAINDGRNPWQNAEQYLIPSLIAVMAYVARYFTNHCAPFSSVCHNASDFLGHVYVGTATLLLILSAGRIQQGMEYMKTLTPLLSKG